MKSFVAIALPLVLIVTQGSLLADAVCDGFAFGNCQKDLLEGYRGQLGVFYSMEELNQTCRSFEEVSACMEKVLPDCNDDLSKQWEDTVTAYQYLCGDALQGYAPVSDCFNRKDIWLVSFINWCHRTRRDVMDVVIRTSHHWLPEDVHKVTCRMYRDYQMCMTRSVVYRCGVEAAKWQRGVLYQLLIPYLRRERC